MRVIHLTPGTGHFVCGSCLRDNTLVAGLRRLGHDVSMVPLYLPHVLEEGAAPAGAAAGARVFMGGINMYLRQKLPFLGSLPGALARRLDGPRLLRWASARSDMTDAAGHGAMMVSMLRGESGRQAQELETLIEWLRAGPAPDVVCLSNVMLIGMARRLKAALGAPLICSLQGEAPFLDALAEPCRAEAWRLIAERAGEVDGFVAVSRHYGELMRERLGFAADRLHVVHNGIELDDIAGPSARAEPTIGYLARMCPDKGLHTLVDAFIILEREGAIEGLRLRVGGVQLASDRPYVAELRRRLARAGFDGDARFQPNVSRAEKLALLESLAVLSVPATYGESFGLYVLEALGAGVPVVQPRHGAFPELIEATGGGRLCEPDDPRSLASELRELLLDEAGSRTLAERGRRSVLERFTADHMARAFENVCMMVAPCRTSSR